jgi:flagellum-specific ATP synthase
MIARRKPHNMKRPTKFSQIRSNMRKISGSLVEGRVTSIEGLSLVASGLGESAKIGDRARVSSKIDAEIVATSPDGVRLLPFGTWDGVGRGDTVELTSGGTDIFPGPEWLGRVVDAFGEPMDEIELPDGPAPYALRNSPIPAFDRRVMGQKLETGVRTIDIFTPICRGQRLGIFAGSGVGKSTLMAMLARQTNADVIVIGLVGERGRELQDFITHDLGAEGMARSVVVAATSDQPPLMRRQAAFTATAVAEYYRDQGKQVLLMIDSVTRFATAQREIGLAAGEPPAARGFTPTVFTELPRLLERSGPGSDKNGQGDITALYTVLVDGDDMNEPISDTVRGILDGHIILDRKVAENGRYPAINISRSVSRALPRCHVPVQQEIMNAARRAMAMHSDIEDLVRIGAYRPGSDKEMDAAIYFSKMAEKYLSQGTREPDSSDVAFANLYGILTEAGIQVNIPELNEPKPARNEEAAQ